MDDPQVTAKPTRALAFHAQAFPCPKPCTPYAAVSVPGQAACPVCVFKSPWLDKLSLCRFKSADLSNSVSLFPCSLPDSHTPLSTLRAGLYTRSPLAASLLQAAELHTSRQVLMSKGPKSLRRPCDMSTLW